MTDRRAILSYQNWAGAPGTVITTSSEETTAPGSNLPILSVYEDFWQTSGTVDASVTWDFGAAAAVDVLALCGLVGFATSDTIRHRLSTASPTVGDLLDTGAVAGNVARDQHCYVLPATLSPRYWRVDISAPSRSALNWFRLGFGWAGPDLGIAHNFEPGWSWQSRDASDIVTSPYAGTEYVNVKPQRRISEITYPALDEAEARDSMDLLQETVGVRLPVLHIPDRAATTTAEAIRRNREMILGRIETSPISMPNIAFYSKSLTIRQML